MEVVGKHSDAIVPILSLKSMYADKSMKDLPLLLQSCTLKASAVVCTHKDLMGGSNLREIKAAVARAFWPKRESTASRVILCSSLMGISSQTLLDASREGKPPFDSLWGEGNVFYPVSNHTSFVLNSLISIQAATAILGMTEEEDYDKLDIRKWRNYIKIQLDRSGLPEAVRQISEDIIDHARPRVMWQEIGAVHHYVRKMTRSDK